MSNAERKEPNTIYFPGESAMTDAQYRLGQKAVAAPGDPREHARKQMADTLARRSAPINNPELPDLEAAIAARHQKWRPKSACRGGNSDLFFPPPHFERKDDREEREAKAKAICRACPVRQQCLDYALASRETDGIWGGLTAKERKALMPD